VKVPTFPARSLQRKHSSDVPTIIVDHSRILHATPDARSRGFHVGKLLEDLSNVDDVQQLQFELDQLIDDHTNFLRAVQDITPMVENFALGELFVELDSDDRFHEIRRTLSDGFPLPVKGAASPTGWLAKILTEREDLGNFSIIDDTEYSGAIQTVKRAELWGLGQHFSQQMRKNDIESLAEIYHMSTAERQQLFQTKTAAIERIFEAQDPRPLNPFSRPESISQSRTISGQVERNTVLKKLKRTAEELADNLESSRSLTHQLFLISQPQEGRETIYNHVFPSPTDEASTLKFTVDSLFDDVSLDPPVKLNLEVTNLVANPDTYHQTVEERYEDLTIL
jgi:nucleotidyltransferase/DNA polymerase involved in DNA repair